MTKAELIEEVSRVVEMTQKDSEAIFDRVARILRRGNNFTPISASSRQFHHDHVFV
jgi:hypothetical protein